MKPTMNEDDVQLPPRQRSTTGMARARFRVSGQAMVKHINVRKQGFDENRILAVDIKLSFAGIDRSICGYFDPLLEDFLWRPSLDGILVPRDTYLDPLTYQHHFSDGMMQVGKENFHNVEGKKFSIAPMDNGRVCLGCSVTIFPDSNKAVDQVSRMLGELAIISLFGPLDLFAV